MSTAENNVSSFDDLVKNLHSSAEVLAKALAPDAAGAADDKKIKAAAGEEGEAVAAAAGAEGAGEGEGEGAGAGDGEGEGAGEGEGSGKNPEDEEEEEEGPMAKSLTLVLEDGSVLEAFDGAEMLKSFGERLEAVSAGREALQENFVKAMGVAVDLLTKQGETVVAQHAKIKEQSAKLDEQGAMLKSLGERVDALASSGRGRATTVTLSEKPGASTQQVEKPQGIPVQELMAKALDAQKCGRISGLEASRVETYVNMGLTPPADLVNKIIPQ